VLTPITKRVDTRPVFKKWHTITLSFEDPETSENDVYNPDQGGPLQNGTIDRIEGGSFRALGMPSENGELINMDWVVLITKSDS